MGNQSVQRLKAKPPVSGLAKGIRIEALKACHAALSKLNHLDDAAFAAAVQIAIAGAGFSAGELGRALSYDTGTIIKWYQGAMAPPRPVVRQEVVESIKVLVDRRLSEWSAARNSAEGIRVIGQRGRGTHLSLRWKAEETELV